MADSSGERPFADFLASGPEPPPALSMDTVDADAADLDAAEAGADPTAGGGAAGGGAAGLDAEGASVNLTATVDYAPEAIEARGAELAAQAPLEQQRQEQQRQEQWQLQQSSQRQPYSSRSTAKVAEQVEWAGSNGSAYTQQQDDQQGDINGGAAPGQRDYMAEYQQRYPSSYQEGAFGAGYAEGGSSFAEPGSSAGGATYSTDSFDSGSDAGSYEVGVSGIFSGRDDSGVFWPDAAGLGDASSPRLAQTSPYQRGSYQDTASQGSSYLRSSGQDAANEETAGQATSYGGSYQEPSDGAQDGRQAAFTAQIPPALLADDIPAAEAGPPALVEAAAAPDSQQSLCNGRQPAAAAGDADATGGLDVAELVEEGLASLRAGRAAAADGAALGDADRLLRQVLHILPAPP